jgi:hypothetical protein
MYDIDQHTIYFSNGKKHKFAMEIAEVMDFEESIVIRLSGSDTAASESIVSFDYNGKFLWKVPTPRTFIPYKPYVSLTRKGIYVEILNWDGHILILHAREGYIVDEGMYTGGGLSTRHTASVRHWI